VIALQKTPNLKTIKRLFMPNETAFALQNNKPGTGTPTILKFEKPDRKYAAQKQKALLAQQEKDRKAIMKEARKRADAAKAEEMAAKGYIKVTVKCLLKYKERGLLDDNALNILQQAMRQESTHIYIHKTLSDQLKALNKQRGKDL
jgi:hypothetical protein